MRPLALLAAAAAVMSPVVDAIPSSNAPNSNHNHHMKHRIKRTKSDNTTVIDASSGTVWATPHDSYSSSIGVLGCYINTNRVAYWPNAIDCTKLCVKLSYEDRSVYLLRIDQSQGAHDVSYDAWNYLYTGYSATKQPTAGGAIAMQFENVDPENCADLIRTDGSKLPLSAPNSMNFLASCLDQPKSWVADNYVLYNIADAVCTLGLNEKCTLDWPDANQPECPHTLGLQDKLTDTPVYNIRYPSGEKVLVSTGEVVAPDAGDDEEDVGLSLSPALLPILLALSVSILIPSGVFVW